jgi:hypothetical protein
MDGGRQFWMVWRASMAASAAGGGDHGGPELAVRSDAHRYRRGVRHLGGRKTGEGCGG